MGRWSEQDILQRHGEAENARTAISADVRDCMAAAMPWRLDKGQRAAFSALFDSSGPTGTQRFASRLQRDMTPPFQRWYKLEAGPLVDDGVREAINLKLELATRISLAVLDASAFAKASHECYADLAIGTGALLVTEGDDREPIRWTSAPPWALGIEEGAFGRIENVFYGRDYPAWVLPRNWPKAVWPEKVRETIAQRPTAKVWVLQASYYDDDIAKWRIAILVRTGDEKAVVWESERRTNPWIVPRWWTTPGCPWGRGPLMLALPDIRTANKTVEMILRAAAYSLAPPLMVLHDGVVNPDQMRLAPSALIRVARTGGPMGRSIEPLDIGSRVDLGQIVLEDQRQSIAKTLLNQQLPPDTGAVRSASEIVEKSKQLQYDAGAAFGRMNHEYVPQVIAAVIDILDLKKVALIDWNELKIDQLILKVNVISPLARAQNLDDVQNTVQWAETLKAIGGDEMLAHAAKVEDFGSYLAGEMGVSQRLVRPKAERDAMEQAAGKAAADSQNAAEAPTDPVGAQPAKFATAPATLALPAPGAA